jgi:hypothetical protein
MALGGLKTEADLKRFLEQQLQTPGVLPQAPQPAISLTKSGEPKDADFPNTPGNGILALDTSTAPPTLYARVGGNWTAL